MVREALLGNSRFERIAARTGLSREVLTDRLCRLVEAGVLEKRPYSARRWGYYPTAAGRDLRPVLIELGR